ncbi:hypothetical protein JOE56_000521 [Brevibacterium paucivorans]|uniref:LPXTG cell wall anchor domain-containing protein n=1 Tax=Brevibacterium paucivorans TaxID=170994 RepID=A0ABS2SHV7_9MICO|nr:hypothetical protein [Brevibacterium paucivorans]MBM7815827.1 hypothetical protein [Brevibacterium paucivorans]
MSTFRGPGPFYVPLMGVGATLIVVGAIAWQSQNRRRKNASEKT